jgi:hypothetical protein
MTTSTGPRQVVDAARAAAHSARRALDPSSTAGSREEWADALSELQRVADVVAAAQDAVIVRLAAIEPEWLEDGTTLEVHRAAGHESLDAPGIVSGVLNVSALHAERRVREAVRLAADGPDGTPTASGLGRLHDAMAAGRLDSYRASVVADELDLAPPEVAESVVTALEQWFEDSDAAALRRRCRRVLARVSPELLRERARRARSESRLERWASEPGVDTWHGTFPSEEAARAWAAVDALAQRYVADGTCERIDRARAKALTDLVEGNATVDVRVLLTVPASSLGSAPAAAPGPVEDPPEHPPGPAPRPGARGSGPVEGPPEPAPRVAPASGGVEGRAEQTPRPGARGSGPVEGPPEPAPRRVARASLLEPTGVDRSADLVEVGGLRPGEPLLARRDWLAAAVAQTRTDTVDVPGHPRKGGSADSSGRRGVADSVGSADHGGLGWCDPGSGGLVDPLDELATDAYRPGSRLAALVRTRDGRCRFPGCHVAARFCDIDHVRPWPLGRTSASNLMCLCRRHHRVKQRPGWKVCLAGDGTVSWIDPTGRGRVTRPIDALDRVVLPARPGEATPHAQPRGRPVVPDGPHSVLEFSLEHRIERRWGRSDCRLDHHRAVVRGWHLSETVITRAHRPPRRERPPPGDAAPPF